MKFPFAYQPIINYQLVKMSIYFFITIDNKQGHNMHKNLGVTVIDLNDILENTIMR